MGKGTIVSHIADGQYSVTVNYAREKYEATISKLAENIASLTTKLYTELQAGTDEYNVAKLQLAALQKEKSNIENSFPEDKTIEAWCADFTKDLSGVVKTVEVPGESAAIQISPGYNGAAEYVASEAGQLVPTVTQGAAQTFYNLAMLPGWQKWKPTFRYGIITSKTGDMCNVNLEAAQSSQQNLNVNQTTTLSNVQIDYMACNGAAFSVGDTVLVKFVGQDWNEPKVIGFKEEPKSCGGYLYITAYMPGSGVTRCFVWNTATDSYATVSKNDGTPAVFPCNPTEISAFISGRTNLTKQLILAAEESYSTYFLTEDISCDCPPAGWDPDQKYIGECSDNASVIGSTVYGVDASGDPASYTATWMGNTFKTCDYEPYNNSYTQLVITNSIKHEIETVRLKNNSLYTSAFKLDNSDLRLGTVFTKKHDLSTTTQVTYVDPGYENSGESSSASVWERKAWDDQDGMSIDIHSEASTSFSGGGEYTLSKTVKQVISEDGPTILFSTTMEDVYYQGNSIFSNDIIFFCSAQKIVQEKIQYDEFGEVSRSYTEIIPFRVRCYTYYGLGQAPPYGGFCPTDGVNPVEVSSRNAYLEAAITEMRESILAAGGEAYKDYSTDIIMTSYIFE